MVGARRAVAALSAVAVLVGGAGACAPGGDGGDGSPRSFAELKRWGLSEWDRWARHHDFRNPVVPGLWSAEKMEQAPPQQPSPAPEDPSSAPSATAPLPTAPLPTAAPATASASATTATATASAPATVPTAPSAQSAPPPVAAQPVPRPYTSYPASGKVFMTAPNGGTGQCSATVVADPAHPGRSNLVWTAAHCVHEGRGGDWYKNLVFVPAYNSSGAGSDHRRATLAEVAPLGQWWADKVITSPLWTTEGTRGGDAANQYDFAVIKVRGPEGETRSLEEVIGTAVPVWFDAPREQLSIQAWGYPAVPPFDGQELERCDSGRPGSRSFDPARPPMLVIGCTMTAGASGGGWFADGPDGRQRLVSNTSIGSSAHTALNGPYLEDVARQALAYLSQK
ncbi:trypsin-like serine peptidase [Kitasatospora sp. NPDC057198]|uniref:trypsin-like serine peptidase n=1 Tax=Kitasatospora sp. NPDC057198 TaxID=3346046 RepID=UPI0036282C7F